MLSLTKLGVESVTPSTIDLVWETDARIKVTEYRLNVKEHGGKDLGTATISGSAIGYQVMGLRPDTMYELRIAPVSRERQFSWSFPVLCQTPKAQPNIFVQSEKALIREAGNSRQVIMARKTRGWKDFVSNGYKVCRPPEQKDLRLQRTLLYAQSLEVFEELYDPDDDYFQGPFYKCQQ